MTFQTTNVSVCDIYSAPAANSALVSKSEFAPTLTPGTNFFYFSSFLMALSKQTNQCHDSCAFFEIMLFMLACGRQAWNHMAQ